MVLRPLEVNRGDARRECGENHGNKREQPRPVCADQSCDIVPGHQGAEIQQKIGNRPAVAERVGHDRDGGVRPLRTVDCIHVLGSGGAISGKAHAHRRGSQFHSDGVSVHRSGGSAGTGGTSQPIPAIRRFSPRGLSSIARHQSCSARRSEGDAAAANDLGGFDRGDPTPE